MAENTTLHKGWLTTRDGAKFAPATLIESVVERDGSSYDRNIRAHITSEINKVSGNLNTSTESINNSIATLQQQLASEAQTRAADDDAIEQKIANFDDDGDRRLYIIDSQSNVIAYVDEQGVTSVDFTTKNGERLSTAAVEIDGLQERMQTAEGDIDTLEHNLRNIGVAEDDDTFYIVDGTEDNNVIAYINKDGVHSINFTIKSDSNLSDYVSLLEQVENHIQEIADLVQADSDINERITQLSSSIDTRLQYFNGDEDEVFYFIDGTEDKNVIAYIDKDGIHTTSLSLAEREGEGITVATKLNIYNQTNELIAYVDTNGVHASNFLLENGGQVKNLNDILVSLQGTDSRLEEALGTTNNNLANEAKARADADAILQGNIDNVNARTQYINGESDDRFYIIDSANNVVAYIDADGVHSTEFTTLPGSNGEVTKSYQVTELGSSIDALEVWQPNIQAQANANTSDVTRLYGIVGEDRNKDIATGADHKSRLTKIDSILDLNSTQSDGKSNRLDRLDTLVGDDSADDGGGATTHEARLRGLRADLTTESGARASADAVLQNRATSLETKTQYLDAQADDKLFIVDGSTDNNVIGYFDASGLTITDIVTKGILLNSSTGLYEKASATLATEQSLNDALVKIYNTLKAHADKNTEEDGRLSSLEGRVSIQEKVTGETTEPASGRDHKSRLDDIDDTLDLDLDSGDAPDGRSKRLDRLDRLVGISTDEINASGTHEARLKSLRADLTTEYNRSVNKDNAHDIALQHSVNYLGYLDALPASAAIGDTCTYNNIAYYYDGSTWKLFEGLSHKLYYVDGTASDKFFIMNGNEEVIAYFDADGLTVTDVKTQGVVNNNGAYSETSGDLSGNTPISLNKQLVDLQTRLADKTTRVTALEQRMSHVTKVMSFEGAVAELPNTSSYQPGDVIVVTGGQNSGKEYVLDTTLGWVEIGYSDYTATAISNLQTVVGRTDNVLPASGKNANMTHDQRLDRLDAFVGYASDTTSDTSHEAHLQRLDETLATETINRTNADDDLRARRVALEQSVNFLGLYAADANIGGSLGDLAVFGFQLKIYNGSSWENFHGLSKKLYYIDGTSDDNFYIVDGSENVIAMFNEAGLTVYDVILDNGDKTRKNKNNMMFFEPVPNLTYNW